MFKLVVVVALGLAVSAVSAGVIPAAPPISAPVGHLAALPAVSAIRAVPAVPAVPAAVHAAVPAALPAPIVTARSSQVIARNYNGFAAAALPVAPLGYVAAPQLAPLHHSAALVLPSL